MNPKDYTHSGGCIYFECPHCQSPLQLTEADIIQVWKDVQGKINCPACGGAIEIHDPQVFWNDIENDQDVLQKIQTEEFELLPSARIKDLIINSSPTRLCIKSYRKIIVPIFWVIGFLALSLLSAPTYAFGLFMLPTIFSLFVAFKKEIYIQFNLDGIEMVNIGGPQKFSPIWEIQRLFNWVGRGFGLKDKKMYIPFEKLEYIDVCGTDRMFQKGKLLALRAAGKLDFTDGAWGLQMHVVGEKNPIEIDGQSFRDSSDAWNRLFSIQLIFTDYEINKSDEYSDPLKVEEEIEIIEEKENRLNHVYGAFFPLSIFAIWAGTIKGDPLPQLSSWLIALGIGVFGSLLIYIVRKKIK